MNKYTLVILLLFSSFFARANFDFNANCLKAYQNIFELKLPAARQLVDAEKKARPQNAIVPLLENYIDFFYLLGSDNKQEIERLERNREARLNQLKNDDSRSPYYLYAQAEIYLQWGLIKGRFGSYYSSARDINRANNLLEENQKRHPGFHLNAKGLGLIHTLMGSLPDGFLKSTLSTFGVKGNVQTGLNLLERLAENLPKSSYEPFYEEAVFYYTYVLNDVVRSPAAFERTMKYTARFASTSLLKTYLQAYAALKNGHNDASINTLLRKPVGAEYQPFPYLDYLMGVAQLNRLDDSAAVYFGKFLRANKGVNYIKDTYLRLAWLALLEDNNTAYSSYMLKVKNLGFTYQEKDKQALNEVGNGVPNKSLLKARLLYDGGYMLRARQELGKINLLLLESSKERAEYYYRLGRVHEDLDNENDALSCYQQAINHGKSLKQYFAAKSGVLAGKIYEKRKNYAKAKSCYEFVLRLKAHDYKTGIENEAKQGLKRIP